MSVTTWDEILFGGIQLETDDFILMEDESIFIVEGASIPAIPSEWGLVAP